MSEDAPLSPTLESLIEDGRRLAFSDGALPVRFKILIVLALGASHGVLDGIEALAEALPAEAMRLGEDLKWPVKRCYGRL